MTSDEAHNKAIRMNKMAEADGFGIGLYAPRWVGSGNNYSILRRGFTFLEREYIFSGVILDPGEKYENGVEVNDFGSRIIKFAVYGTPSYSDKQFIESHPEFPWEFNDKTYLPPWHGKEGVARVQAKRDSADYANHVKVGDTKIGENDFDE